MSELYQLFSYPPVLSIPTNRAESECVGQKPAQNVVKRSVTIKCVIELKTLDNRLFFEINNHEIGITFTDVNTQIKWFHFESLLFRYTSIMECQESSAL